MENILKIMCSGLMVAGMMAVGLQAMDATFDIESHTKMNAWLNQNDSCGIDHSSINVNDIEPLIKELKRLTHDGEKIIGNNIRVINTDFNTRRDMGPLVCDIFGRPDAVAVIDILMQAGFKFDFEVKGLNNCSPLDNAAHELNSDAVKKLIALGVKLNQKDQFEKTPLMYVCEELTYFQKEDSRNKCLEIIKTLIANGADTGNIVLDMFEQNQCSDEEYAEFSRLLTTDCTQELQSYVIEKTIQAPKSSENPSTPSDASTLLKKWHIFAGVGVVVITVAAVVATVLYQKQKQKEAADATVESQN